MQVQQCLAMQDQSSTAEHLTHCPHDMQDAADGWGPLLCDFWSSPAGSALSLRLNDALAAGHTIYPAQPLRALSLTPLSQVRVVILGQDPYPGPGQAEGLAFSVAPELPLPPSLRNIFKELKQSLGVPVPSHGSLVRWAQQGVLLLNTCLTVQAGQAAGHAGWGWETLTDALVAAVAKRSHPVVFMLWGAHAQAKMSLIEAADTSARHLILVANHPSPLSAMRPPRPFLGCGHFKRAAEFLKQQGEEAIKW